MAVEIVEVATGLSGTTSIQHKAKEFQGDLYIGSLPNAELLVFNAVTNQLDLVASQLSGTSIVNDLEIFKNELYGAVNKLAKLNPTKDAWLEVAPKPGSEDCKTLSVFENDLYIGTESSLGELYKLNATKDGLVQVASQYLTTSRLWDSEVHENRLYFATWGSPGRLLRLNLGKNALEDAAPTYLHLERGYTLSSFDGDLYVAGYRSGSFSAIQKFNATSGVMSDVGNVTEYIGESISYKGKLYFSEITAPGDIRRLWVLNDTKDDVSFVANFPVFPGASKSLLPYILDEFSDRLFTGGYWSNSAPPLFEILGAGPTPPTPSVWTLKPKLTDGASFNGELVWPSTNLEIKYGFKLYVENVKVTFKNKFDLKYTGFESKKYKIQNGNEKLFDIMLVGDLPRWLQDALLRLAIAMNGSGMILQFYDDWVTGTELVPITYEGRWLNAADFVDNNELLCGGSIRYLAYESDES
jgi:hypothetical protein